MTYVDFLSTLSLRRATTDAINGCNPDIFSIHALLAESDIFALWMARSHLFFLSTLSLRRATTPPYNLMIQHTLFYPRSPCGERLKGIINGLMIGSFLSTLSLRRATSKTVRRIWRMLLFYPRSPCGERLAPPYNLMIQQNFLSTLSLRRAT